MTRMTLSGSPTVASARNRGAGEWTAGGGRAHVAAGIDGIRLSSATQTAVPMTKPTHYPRSTTELTGNVRQIDGDVTLGDPYHRDTTGLAR